MKRCLIAILFAVAAQASPVLADDGKQVAELTEQLDGSRTEKERIAAVTKLAKLSDKKTLKPLVNALRDSSATVRAVAALGLGKLGHRAALPALRGAVEDDDDALVRKRAREAVAKICKANGIDDDGGAGSGLGDERGHETRPELHVIVKSASDDSPAASKPRSKSKKKSAKERRLHAAIARSAMTAAFDGSDLVAASTKDADRYGLETHNIDVTITKLETRTVGTYIEVEAQLRIAISDAGGKMLSFVSGGAKVQVKKASYDTGYLPQLRREAIENAVAGLFDKLVEHLRRGAKA